MRNEEHRQPVTQPKEPNISAIARESATQPLESMENKYPDSVNEHKALEATNNFLNEGEIKQQNENL
ncbi:MULTISPECIES: hypothetical protein [Bacillus]|uniref:hypothetical protein n=1 Tax=Bacillus TaxID=1386 RepID=UPI000BB7624B|nr:MULTISPECIES: hypothetical protein [Bacillus]